MSCHMEGNRFINAADSGSAIILGQQTTVVGLLHAMARLQESGAPAWMIARGLRELANDIDPPQPAKRKWWQR